MTDIKDEILDQNDDNNNLGPGEDKLEVGFQILAFCIPLAGAILYFVNKDKYPKKAQTACYAALIGMGVGIVLNVLATVMGGM